MAKIIDVNPRELGEFIGNMITLAFIIWISNHWFNQTFIGLLFIIGIQLEGIKRRLPKK